MHKTFGISILAFLLCICAVSVTAIPSYEGVTTWSSIGSLVPGMSYLEAIGAGRRDSSYAPQYLSIAAPHGNPGNVTIRQEKSPHLFYIHNNQLWHYHNASTIFPVNVYNSTGSADKPLQLKVEKKVEGVKGGSWRWQGTMLFYETGNSHNSGVYYACQDTNGLMGLYTYMAPSPTPDGCSIFTVHSFVKR